MLLRIVLSIFGAVVFGAPGSLALTKALPSAIPEPMARAPSRVTGALHPAPCTELYSNVDIPSAFYFPAGAGVEVLDDLHVTSPGHACALDFGYFKENPGTVDVTVTLYTNDGLDSQPKHVVAGPFVLTGLASGDNAYHLELPMMEAVQDVWVGVAFSTDDAGLLIMDPPSAGVSHDFFYMRPPADYFMFGGSPAADFYLSLYGDPSTVAVEPGAGRENRLGFTAEPSPNPTVSRMTFRFALRKKGLARAEVFDLHGRHVTTILGRVLEPGSYEAMWDRRESGNHRVAAGVYYLRLTLPGFTGSRKLVVTD